MSVGGFLPSKDELQAIYTNLHIGLGLGDFYSSPGSNYWSSSEFSASTVWITDFSDGSQYSNADKQNYTYARAVWSFTVATESPNAGEVLKYDGTNWVNYDLPEKQLVETVFTSSNASWAIPSGVTKIWALCVGSGGGGGATSTTTASNSGGGGGAGQAIEQIIVISGDTTLNITVPAGGAGGSGNGSKGGVGSSATIVGNTSGTTYLQAFGGGGGGGGASTTTTGISGASGGGQGSTTSQSSSAAGAGGGAGSSPYASLSTFARGTGGAAAMTLGVTGFNGASAGASFTFGGEGIRIFGRLVCGGGVGANTTNPQLSTAFGAAAATALNTAGDSANNNTGAGGNGAKTGASTALAGGDGGSGLVVLRYVF
jgi:hypothetical protein